MCVDLLAPSLSTKETVALAQNAERDRESQFSTVAKEGITSARSRARMLLPLMALEPDNMHHHA